MLTAATVLNIVASVLTIVIVLVPVVARLRDADRFRPVGASVRELCNDR